MATLNRSFDGVRSPSKRFSLPDAERLSAPAEEDEDDFNESIDSEDHEEEILPDFLPGQRYSNVSIIPIPILPDKPRTRSYKFVQLERALIVANLLDDPNDRIKFQQDYRQSLQENHFDEFLQKWHGKLKDHKAKLEEERTIKRSPSLTFVDLEKNFLALDPTRAIKIVFIDDDNTSKLHRTSTLSNTADEDSIEEFYKGNVRRLLRNPSRAHNEITVFARQAAEHLDQRLPNLTDVPHRVKIIDERERKDNFDEHTLRHMKHKHALSLITKRRQLTLKMLEQSRKNEARMARMKFQPPLSTANSSSCRELLERINQIEHVLKQERYNRPQTTCIPQRTISKTTNYSSSQTTRTMMESITPTFSSSSTPFPVNLSIYHAEKTNSNRIVLPKRSFSAPIKKLTWENYC